MGTTAQKYHGVALLHDFVSYMKITQQGNYSLPSVYLRCVPGTNPGVQALPRPFYMAPDKNFCPDTHTPSVQPSVHSITITPVGLCDSQLFVSSFWLYIVQLVKYDAIRTDRSNSDSLAFRCSSYEDELCKKDIYLIISNSEKFL